MKILLVPALLFLCFQSFAQEKFIEVTISDTAWVKPDHFVYRITVTNENDEAVADTAIFDPQVYKERRKQKTVQRTRILDSVKLAIKRSGYRILSPTLDDAFSSVGDMEYKVVSILVVTGSIDSLRLLHNIISANQSLQAGVESAFAKDETPDQARLYKKLLAQAAKNATLIATLSERKLGKIIAVTELSAAKNEAPGWTIYPPLSAMAGSMVPGWHTTIQSKATYNLTNEPIVSTYLISNTLTVKFALE